MTTIFQPSWTTNNIFLTAPLTPLKKIIENAIELLRFKPEILDRINEDQDAIAKKKKKLRLEDKKYYNDKTQNLSGMEISEKEIEESDIQLEIGRSRMLPQVAFLFFIIRGYFGSVTSQTSVQRMHDSMTLYTILQEWVVEMPGVTTILENINAISNETREYILDAQIEQILAEGLEEFEKLQIDSTSIEANTEWPTDARILLALLTRAYQYSQKLSLFGVDNFSIDLMESWLKRLKKILFKINLTSGKAKSKGKIKVLYRRYLRIAQRVHDLLIEEENRVKATKESVDLAPSRLDKLNRVWDRIDNDLIDAGKVLYYTEDRIFNEVVLKASEKILSISDRSAAFIKKGNRNPVIGYKPQVARSGNGFIPSLIVPEGNADDSGELIPILLDVKRRATVVPKIVSVDDGYASAEGRKKALEMGVEILSIGGAKGKKLIPETDWNSLEYMEARAERSAVESIMFTLKYVFEFGRLRRRGIDEVRAELLEKVIVFNFYRANILRQHAKAKNRNAA